MSGSLNDILPDTISEESERILVNLLMRKGRIAAGLAVRLLHAMEERFGPEAREVVRDMAGGFEPTPRPVAGEPESDLREFCAFIDRAGAGSLQKERVIDEPDRVGYRITRCMWADNLRGRARL